MLALTDSVLAPLRHLRHGPRPDRRRALELLAASPEGCTEAIMLAHGFSLRLDGRACSRRDSRFASTRRVVAGKRMIEVV